MEKGNYSCKHLSKYLEYCAKLLRIGSVNHIWVNFKEIIMVTRKYLRIVILLACGIALVLASSSCKKKEEPGAGKEPNIPPKLGPPIDIPRDEGPAIDIPIEPPSVTPTPKPGKAFVIEPLVGIGKVRFDMTVEQMKQILGEPVQIRGPVHEYLDSGFAIFAMNDAVTMIACGDRRSADSPRTRNCKSRTKKGIGMGSGREDIILAYGQPSSTESVQLRIGGSAVTLRYDSLNSQFMLMNDKVFYMSFAAKGSLIGAGRPRPPRPRSR
jgi:hypothetical protein